MEPFVSVLQQQIYKKRSLHVEAVAEGIEVTRMTLWAWVNERWPIPLYGARKLVAHTQNPSLARALVIGTGLRIVPVAPYLPSAEPLFYVLGQHMSIYSRMLELLDKAKKQTITKEEVEEGERLCEDFRALNELVEAEFKRIKDKE